MNTNTTTLKLNAADVLMLLNSMEAEWTDHMTEDELKAHDKLYSRLTKAYERVA